jgi:CBS domain-containing protein
VGELANFSLIRCVPADLMGDALATMIKHKVRRVLVAEGEQISGFWKHWICLDSCPTSPTRSTSRSLVAQDIEALKAAAGQITRLIALLHRSGTKVNMIARLVQELNLRLFERTWQFIAPPDLRANSCLFVMGSEGRGEQLLKTDQDNGLVLRDGYECSVDLAEVCRQFSSALADFGYPACPETSWSATRTGARVCRNSARWCACGRSQPARTA